MFKSKDELVAVFCSVFSVVLLLIASVLVGKIVLGIYCAAAVALMGFGQRVLGRNQGRDENLGKLVEVSDLAVGYKYIIARSPNGQFVIGKLVHGYGGYNSLHFVRAFDIKSTCLYEELYKLPIGGAMTVEKQDDDLRQFVGMAA